MGGGSWTKDAFTSYSKSVGRSVGLDGTMTSRDTSAQQMFRRRGLDPALSPYNAMRECRDTKEHPRKTRQSEFLKMFPNARIAPDGCIGGGCCPSDLDTTYVCPMEKSPCRSGCPECRRAYWRAEVSDNAD